MTMFPVNTNRHDPYKIHKFRVKWDAAYIPGIIRVSPLLRTTEAVEFREGSAPNTTRVAPGQTMFAPVKIERGLSHDHAFEQWANMVNNLEGDAAMSLAHYRKDVVIELLNMQGSLVMAYKLYRCWVSEYQALPELDAGANCIAIESIVLEHEGWERDLDVTEPTET